jgi:hypothetical protein
MSKISLLPFEFDGSLAQLYRNSFQSGLDLCRIRIRTGKHILNACAFGNAAKISPAARSYARRLASCLFIAHPLSSEVVAGRIVIVESSSHYYPNADASRLLLHQGRGLFVPVPAPRRAGQNFPRQGRYNSVRANL